MKSGEHVIEPTVNGVGHRSVALCREIRETLRAYADQPLELKKLFHSHSFIEGVTTFVCKVDTSLLKRGHVASCFCWGFKRHREDATSHFRVPFRVPILRNTLSSNTLCAGLANVESTSNGPRGCG